jgi:hypothetical protein
MPFCPKCGSEYREGADTCSVCQVPLVDELEPQTAGDVELVEVYRAPDEVTAIALSGRLESAGIPAAVQSLESFGYEWTDLGRGYWGKILVRKQDAEKARRIIEDAIAGLPEEVGE